VAERGELPTEMPEVDALAPAVRLAAVGQQSDSHGQDPPGSSLPSARPTVGENWNVFLFWGTAMLA
jgi:hypothetical protein